MSAASDIAIVGAGIAGLALANRLKMEGIPTVIFDEMAEPGGRMATYREGHYQFDHGAQFFTAKGSRFRAMTAGWRDAGLVGEWFAGGFVGIPRMDAPVMALAQDATVISRCKIIRMCHSNGVWTLTPCAEGGSNLARMSFSRVVLAIPAPQALQLTSSAELACPELHKVQYGPCWAMMLAFTKETGLLENSIRFKEGAISSVVRDACKPGRPKMHETFTIHASTRWSLEHLEWTPDEVVRALTQELRNLLGLNLVPAFAAGYRWRYALVEKPAGIPFFWNGKLGLGACGDWCLGARVEAAFESGEALAEAIIRSGITQHAK